MELSALLHPFDVDTFQEEYWEQRPLNVSRNDPSYYHRLFKLEDVATVIELAQAMDQWMGEILVFKKLQQLDCSLPRVYDAYLDGASLVINHVDKLCLPLNRLCQSLGLHFHHVFANMYFTPPNSQAVPPHSDDRDVFLLQLAGEKNWKIYRAPIQLPFTDEMLGKNKSRLSPRIIGEPLYEYTLRQGDLMYIPRGNVHEAHTSSKCSLHVTLAIPTADFTYAVLLEDALRQFTRSSTDMSLRKSVPLGSLNQVEKRNCDSLVQNILKTAQAELSFDKLHDIFKRRMQRHRDIQASCVRELPHVELIKLSDLYKRQRGIAMDIQMLREEGGSGILVTFYHKDNRLRRKFGEHLLLVMKFIETSKRPFTVTELPARDDFEKIAVVRTLLAVDILERVEQTLAL